MLWYENNSSIMMVVEAELIFIKTKASSWYVVCDFIYCSRNYKSPNAITYK